MLRPLVCFITWNRAGLTARNLRALLESTDDFELFIVDNNSQDDTWRFIEGIQDPRIKEKKRFDRNRGFAYGINDVFSKRKKDQYFIWIENDVCIYTKDWVRQFLKVMEAFPEVGLLGAVRDKFYQKHRSMMKIVQNGDVVYYEFPRVTGCCNCWRPELIEVIGYLNEETYGGDTDNWYRINNFTSFKMGYVPAVRIDQVQWISCEECLMQQLCRVRTKSMTCFDIYKSRDLHRDLPDFRQMKTNIYRRSLESGEREVYCASIHDPESRRLHYYNRDWAEENFHFFASHDDEQSINVGRR